MIIMYTLYYPSQMQEKLMEMAAKMITNKQPAYVKKWLSYGAMNGPNGFKWINIIHIEKGHADEASIELTKLFIPILKLGNFELQSEILGSIRDIMEIYRK